MSRPQLESLPATSGCQYMDFCCGRSSALVLGSVMGLLSSTQPNPPPARTVMGRRDEAKFNRSTSHDCSTNAAIQEPVCIKQHTCHCARALRMRILFFFFFKEMREKKNKRGVNVGLISKLQSRNFPLLLDLLLHNTAEIGATEHKRLVG